MKNIWKFENEILVKGPRTIIINEIAMYFVENSTKGDNSKRLLAKLIENL